jgi:hypothetical protein
MLKLTGKRNTTQKNRASLEVIEDLALDLLLEGGAQTTYPFDNCGSYTDLWRNISTHLTDFAKAPEPFMKVKEQSGKYSLLRKDDTPVKQEISSVDVSIRMVLQRYVKVLNIISNNEKLTHVPDFFNELESNREYHSRQLYVLCKTSKSYLEPRLNPYVTSFNENNLEVLDKILFQANQDLSENPYECIWVLNHIMIFLAEWEIKTKPTLFKEDFLSTIVAENVSNLPSNLRMLSRMASRKKEKVLEMYPYSLLMNYSHFFPLNLYHTGKEPDSLINT